MPSHKSDMNNSFRIIFMKINIVKVNIRKIHTKNTHFNTKKCDITRICIIKNYMVFRKLSIIIFLSFFVKNQSRINFNACRRASTVLLHISQVLYLSSEYFKLIFGNSFVTHFLYFILIMDKIKYKRTTVRSFNTFLCILYHSSTNCSSFQKIKYRQLYCPFFESYSNQGQILMYIIVNGFIAQFLIFIALRNIF